MKRNKISINTFILFSILAIFSSCNGQNAADATSGNNREYSFAITTGDTVSELDKSIWFIFQDKNNHYWFASNGKGLYRHDGKILTHFTTGHGLLNDSIRGIQEDKTGNIFITSLGGIQKFDGRKFTTLPAVSVSEWKNNPDDLWFYVLGKAGEDGPYRYDGKTLYHLKFPKHRLEDQYYRDNPNRPWSPYEVYSIYKDSKGNIWFGTSNFGICRFDGRSLSWMYEEHLTLIEGGGSFGIRSIIEDKEGKFWFCNTSYRYNISPEESGGQDKTLINYKREKGIDNFKTLEGKDMIYFMSAVEDNNGDMWMATYSQGVWKYDGKDITRFPVKKGAEDITLFSIYKDKQGDLWLGTHEAGAYKFNGKSFEKFSP